MISSKSALSGIPISASNPVSYLAPICSLVIKRSYFSPPSQANLSDSHRAIQISLIPFDSNSFLEFWINKSISIYSEFSISVYYFFYSTIDSPNERFVEFSTFFPIKSSYTINFYCSYTLYLAAQIDCCSRCPYNSTFSRPWSTAPQSLMELQCERPWQLREIGRLFWF